MAMSSWVMVNVGATGAGVSAGAFVRRCLGAAALGVAGVVEALARDGAGLEEVLVFFAILIIILAKRLNIF